MIKKPKMTVNIVPGKAPIGAVAFPIAGTKFVGRATIPVTYIESQGVGKLPKREIKAITVSPAVLGLWHDLQKAHALGYRLTAEKLGHNSTSFCVEHKDKGDVQIQLVPTVDAQGKATDFAAVFIQLIDAQHKTLPAKG